MQEENPLVFILLPACPAPIVGDYKQDALVSAHKSPQVAPWPPALDRGPSPHAPQPAGANFLDVCVLCGVAVFCILMLTFWTRAEVFTRTLTPFDSLKQEDPA